ncbi:34964_t:CDS:2, partial [Gigaspora margarita]
DGTKIEKEIPNNDTKAKESPPMIKKEVPNKTLNDKRRNASNNDTNDET